MKIGVLTCELAHTHGWAHYSLSLIRALRRAGVEMIVITSRNSPPLEDIETYPLMPTITPRERAILPKMILQTMNARRLLRSCDIIHTTIEPFAPLGEAVTGNRPFFVTGHGSYMALSRRRGWPVSALYRHAFQHAHIVCVSHYTEKVVHSVLPGVRTSVVNNGVDIERFQHIVHTPHSGRKTVLAVGAIKPRKGTLQLVQAMAEVRQQIPDVRCIIIGSLTLEPGYVEQVKAAIRDLHLENTVELLGHVPDETLMDWYKDADVFVVPSINDGWKFEGYGLVYLEASAAGLPVIGTSENGGEDAVDDGLTGLIVPQTRITEKLPAAILRLLTDSELAARMGAAGRAKALNQTWDHVAQQMIELYTHADRKVTE